MIDQSRDGDILAPCHGSLQSGAVGFTQGTDLTVLRCRHPTPMHEGVGTPGSILAIRKAQAIGDGNEGILARRMHPMAAEIEGDAGCQLLGIGATTDTMRRFQYEISQLMVPRRLCGCEAGGPGPDDDHIDIRHLLLSLNLQAADRGRDCGYARCCSVCS